MQDVPPERVKHFEKIFQGFQSLIKAKECAASITNLTAPLTTSDRKDSNSSASSSKSSDSSRSSSSSGSESESDEPAKKSPIPAIKESEPQVFKKPISKVSSGWGALAAEAKKIKNKKAGSPSHQDSTFAAFKIKAKEEKEKKMLLDKQREDAKVKKQLIDQLNAKRLRERKQDEEEEEALERVRLNHGANSSSEPISSEERDRQREMEHSKRKAVSTRLGS